MEEEDNVIIEAIAASHSMVLNVENQLKRRNLATDSEKQFPVKPKPCIYRAPLRIRKGAEEHFEPKLVSLGPYHFGKPHLAAFEAIKGRCLLRCLRRVNIDLKVIEAEVTKMVTDLYDCYDNLWHGWNIIDSPENFVRLMVVDGCFFVEIFGASVPDSVDDPAIFQLYMANYNVDDIFDDALLLENQLPHSLLQLLFSILRPGKTFKDAVSDRILHGFWLECFHNVIETKNDPANFKHSLDYVTSPINFFSRRQRGRLFAGHSTKSAVEVSNAGVDFRPSRKIRFHNGIVSLPSIKITYRTKRRLLNAISYELLRGGDAMVTDHAIFMANLLKTPEDVKLLCSKYIIFNQQDQGHQAVVDLFRNITRGLIGTKGNDSGILNEIYNYCDTKWRRVRAHLKGTYFRSPWAMLSLVYAIIIFLFIVAQTFYTIATYYSSTDGTEQEGPES